MDIKNYGKGAVKNPLDLRDFRFEPIAGADILPVEFSLKDKIGRVENQDGSSSCVSQAFSSYAEVLNTIETGEKKQLSPRDIYSLTFLPNGGSFLRDAAKKICNSGVVPEDEAPSYENGNPPSEAFMRNRADITQISDEDGMKYLSKTFVTWDNTNFDNFKRAIYQGNGCVIACWGNDYCWQNAIILTPDNASQTTWGHGVFCCGFKTINGIEYLEFLNSWGTEWGDGGYGYLPKSYIEKGLVFNPVTLIDVPNNTYSNMQKTISILKNLILLYQQLIAKLKK